MRYSFVLDFLWCMVLLFYHLFSPSEFASLQYHYRFHWFVLDQWTSLDLDDVRFLGGMASFCEFLLNSILLHFTSFITWTATFFVIYTSFNALSLSLILLAFIDLHPISRLPVEPSSVDSGVIYSLSFVLLLVKPSHANSSYVDLCSHRSRLCCY